MVELRDLRRISDHEWEIPTSVRADMRVPVRVFASRALLEAIGAESSLEQAVNAATLPGRGRARAGDARRPPGLRLPDRRRGRHRAAARRDLAGRHRLRHQLRRAAARLQRPLRRRGGVDRRPGLRPLRRLPERRRRPAARLKLDDRELERVCREGGEWARRHGWGTESGRGPHRGGRRARGRRLRARSATGPGSAAAPRSARSAPATTSSRSMWSTRSSTPTRRGSWGCTRATLAVQIHCGSRGFGHQVCTDYVQVLPERGATATASSCPTASWCARRSTRPRARPTWPPCACAANFAFANRQVLAHLARGAFARRCAAAAASSQLHQVYDIAHNMGKIEEHSFDGVRRQVCVHRKGATRAFGPGFDGPAAGVPRHRPAGAGPGQHGHRLVGAGRHRGQHGALVRLDAATARGAP